MKKSDGLPESEILRQKAESLLKNKLSCIGPILSETEVRKLVHELEVHQVELEIQNAELRLARDREADIASEKYMELYDFAPTGYYTLSRQGQIIQLNLNAAALLGNERTTLKNKFFGDFVSKETLETYNHFLGQVFSSISLKTCELILLSGNNLPIDVYLTGIVTGNGEQCLLSMVDITDRKNAEKQLILLNHAVEQSPVSIVITDKNSLVEYVNPKFTELTGYTLDEVKGKNPNILQSGNQSNEFYRELWSTLMSGQNWYGEFHNKKKNDEYYWESAVIAPILDCKGDIVHSIALKEDITEKKKMLEDLIQAKEHAEESDRLKTAFLANMSHEIRTPMNGILGFAELLKDPDLTSEKQQYFISIIEKSGFRMLNIINDILCISKIESGQVTVTVSETNINESIEFVCTFFKPEIEQKGLKISSRMALPFHTAILSTDREKFFAILVNLVKNAVKFTQTGSIEVGYEKKGRYLQFYVRDTGIGIKPEYKEIIFERFMQASDLLTRKHEGTGLGLSIAKAYTEMLGGTIWFESVLENLPAGKAGGSTFYFTLPFPLPKSDQIIEAEY